MFVLAHWRADDGNVSSERYDFAADSGSIAARESFERNAHSTVAKRANGSERRPWHVVDRKIQQSPAGAEERIFSHLLHSCGVDGRLLALFAENSDGITGGKNGRELLQKKKKTTNPNSLT